jgi:hypothetical protein
LDARIRDHQPSDGEAVVRVAMIGTGGDPGHAPARRVYESADYTLMPMARYFKAL